MKKVLAISQENSSKNYKLKTKKGHGPFHSSFEHVQEKRKGGRSMLFSFTHKKALAAVSCLVLAALLAAGCSLQKEEASDELWGRADAKEIDINSKVAGRVISLRIKEGDQVQKGEVIAYIDQRDLLAQKAQAEANIKALEAQVRQSGVVTDLQDSTSKSQVDTASAGLDSAQSNLELAEKNFNRYQELYDQGAVSKSVFDSYKTKYEVAQSAYSQAQAGVSSAHAGLLQTDANEAATDAAQKKLEAAQAQLQQIEVSLDETEIKAPFDGVITAKYVEEGSMISLGTPLVAIQDPTDNWVDFKVPETKLNDFHVGDVLQLQARDGVTRVQGTITDISQKSEFATQRATSERGDDTDIISFNVKVQVDDPALRPGMRFQYMAGE